MKKNNGFRYFAMFWNLVVSVIISLAFYIGIAVLAVEKWNFPEYSVLIGIALALLSVYGSFCHFYKKLNKKDNDDNDR